MSSNTLWADTETFSECDLRKAGAHRYAEDDTTEVMLFPFALGDGEVHLWDRTGGVDRPEVRAELKKLAVDASRLHTGPAPADLQAALDDGECRTVWHNAAFDMQLVNTTMGLGLPVERFYCLMAHALSMGLPGSLEKLGEVVGLADDEAKLREGKKLIRRFCMPQPKNHKVRRWTAENDPEGWAKFCLYAIQDVAAMREIHRRLPNPNYRGRELALWHLDQKINNAGLPIDTELVDAAFVVIDCALESLNERTRELTDGALANTKSRAKVLAWLEERGVDMPGYTKVDVAAALEREDLPADAREVLEIRQQEGRAATAKYQAILNTMCRDKRVRGTLQYYGAQRTGRWAGRHLQLQNMYKSQFKDFEAMISAMKESAALVDMLYGDLMAVAGSAVRGAIAAPKGKRIAASDFSAVEGRGLACLAGETWKIEAFRAYDRGEGAGIYEVTAGGIYAVDPMTIGDKDPRRQVGKTGELACGYMGGIGAFGTFAVSMGVDLEPALPALLANSSPEEIEQAEGEVEWFAGKSPESYAQLGHRACMAAALTKNKWRAQHKATVKFWYDCEDAAKKAIRDPGSVHRAGTVAYSVRQNILLARLPSGRFLCYPSPKLEQDGRKEKITFMGVDQYTRKWCRQTTYAGKLVENITQAVCRDLMAEALFNLDAAGFEVIGSVHDEALVLIDEDTDPAAITACMEKMPEWAKDWPITAGTDVHLRYQK